MISWGELASQALRDKAIANLFRTHREVDFRHGRDLHSLGIVVVPSIEGGEIVLLVEHRAAAEASPSPHAAKGYSHRITGDGISVRIGRRKESDDEYLDCGSCSFGITLSSVQMLGLVLGSYGWGSGRGKRDARRYYASLG